MEGVKGEVELPRPSMKGERRGGERGEKQAGGGLGKQEGAAEVKIPAPTAPKVATPKMATPKPSPKTAAKGTVGGVVVKSPQEASKASPKVR